MIPSTFEDIQYVHLAFANKIRIFNCIQNEWCETSKRLVIGPSLPSLVYTQLTVINWIFRLETSDPVWATPNFNQWGSIYLNQQARSPSTHPLWRRSNVYQHLLLKTTSTNKASHESKSSRPSTVIDGFHLLNPTLITEKRVQRCGSAAPSLGLPWTSGAGRRSTSSGILHAGVGLYWSALPVVCLTNWYWEKTEFPIFFSGLSF